MRNWIKFSYLTVIYLFLYFPIAVLVAYSFNRSGLSGGWEGFTLDWYKQLLQNPALLRIAFNSILLGTAAATLATLLGTLAAICLYRYEFSGKKLLSLLLFTLMISPEIVMAVSLLLLFALSDASLGFLTLLLSHATFCMPFVAVMTYSRLLSIDKNVINAAKELGAGEYSILSRILFPLLKLNIFAGWLLSFILSVDDVMISFFLSGPTFKVLPLEIYAWVRLGVRPELNALCSVLLGFSLVVVLFFQCLSGEND